MSFANAQMGPAVLTPGRGPSSSGQGNALFNIRPFASIQGTYSDSLSPTRVDETGELRDLSSAGLMATFGAYGYHRWRRSILGLAYQGRARHHTRAQSFNGIDQTLSLGFSQQVTPRWTYSLNQSASVFTTGLGLPGMGAQAGQSFGFMPNLSSIGVTDVGEELVDVRTYAFASSASVTYQPNARLYYTGGVTGFAVRRRSGMAGMDGFAAQGAVGYALSRRQSVGIRVMHGAYYYTRGFGEANVQAVMPFYSRQLDRHWSMSVGAGATRLGSTGLTRVILDPTIRAVLGQSTAIEIANREFYGFGASLNVNGQFRRSSANVGYTRYISPGNGIFLASQADSAYAAYSYTGLRIVSVGGNAQYTRMSPRQQSSLNTTSERYGAGAFVSRRITSWMFYSASAGLRRIEIQDRFQRNSYSVSMGFTFSPGETPVSFW